MKLQGRPTLTHFPAGRQDTPYKAYTKSAKSRSLEIYYSQFILIVERTATVHKLTKTNPTKQNGLHMKTRSKSEVE